MSNDQFATIRSVLVSATSYSLLVTAISHSLLVSEASRSLLVTAISRSSIVNSNNNYRLLTTCDVPLFPLRRAHYTRILGTPTTNTCIATVDLKWSHTPFSIAQCSKCAWPKSHEMGFRSLPNSSSLFSSTYSSPGFSNDSFTISQYDAKDPDYLSKNIFTIVFKFLRATDILRNSITRAGKLRSWSFLTSKVVKHRMEITVCKLIGRYDPIDKEERTFLLLRSIIPRIKTKAGRMYYALMMRPLKQPLTGNHSQQVSHWYIPPNIVFLIIWLIWKKAV